MPVAPRITPFWEQYQRLKAQHPDALLWTRMGDFYEMFEEDARTAARELHITLTSREFGKELRVPLAGVPYHAAEGYLARLIRKGYHVAICEQMSEPGHGLVDREVVRVVTPGTLVEPGLLPQRANNYLAAVVWREDAGGLAYVDVSTGEFWATEFDGAEAAGTLEAELRRLAPAECLTPSDQVEPCPLPGHRTTRDSWHFDEEATREQLRLHFGAQSLAAFGCDALPLATICAGAIVRYIGQTNESLLPLLTSLRGYTTASFMQLDGQTRRNLNLTAGVHGGQDGSLLAVLDRTKTAFGARLLRRWLGQPLIALEPILSRQQIVAALVEETDLRGELRHLLDGVLDVERIVGRCRSGAATPRDLTSLGRSLEVARDLRRLAPDLDQPLRALVGDLDPCADVAAAIATAVAELGSGRIIAPGYSGELDTLLAGSSDDRTWIHTLEAQERARTGIKSLKVGVNQVFGYYLEVTKPNLALVPSDYVRKQTVAGGERYITPELKEVESRLLRAGEDADTLERRLFADLLRRLAEQGERLLTTARRMAEIDAFCALAEVAGRNGWARPDVDESETLDLRDGRHPVVEAATGREAFIPNDCLVDCAGPRLLLITGPNMAGKSTYLRQVALIVLLAQVGSFVPAATAHVGLVDRIFTRVGAHDDLAGGASTFMVEMLETATICRQATARSLVVLDEIGRGTSTEDGQAIAQAVIEYLHNEVGVRTLCATHFHELAGLARTLPHLELWTFAVLELSGQIAFTHRIAPGAAQRSYGLHVARLAGLPPSIMERAQAILEDDATPSAPSEPVMPRENGRPSGDLRQPGDEFHVEQIGHPERSEGSLAYPDAIRGHMLSSGTRDSQTNVAALLDTLVRLDVAQTTPLQALLKLADVQQAARRLLESG